MSADRVLSIVLTGRGGQGTKLTSELLAWSAAADGFNPIQYSVYGALIRGGEIACSLAVSRGDPGVPLRSSYALMAAMHNDWFERYYPMVVPGGLLVYDEAKLDEATLERNDVTHVALPLAALAAGSGDPRAANMVIAGVVAGLTGIATPQALAKGMAEVVPAHRAERIARNLHAVEIGYSWVGRECPDVVERMHLA